MNATNYIVICRLGLLELDSSDAAALQGAPGPYVLATRQVFSTRTGANMYAATISPSRDPLVVEGRFFELRYPMGPEGRELTDEQLCDAVAAFLLDLGATSEHTGGNIHCVFVPEGPGRWILGMADVTWGGQLLDADGEAVESEDYIQTTVPSDSQDPRRIADAIRQAVLARRALGWRARPKERP